MRKELGFYVTTEYQKPRRLACLHLSADFLFYLAKGKGQRHFETSMNCLPDDVRMLGCVYDPMYQRWELLLTSETFEEVDPAVMPPVLPPPVWRSLPEEARLEELRRESA